MMYINNTIHRCAAHGITPPILGEFVLRNDTHLFAPVTGLAPLLHRAQLRLLNSTTSLASLHKALEALDLPNEVRLRPSWDQYFMQLADLAAHRSNCMKRRVGCVLVREKRVVSTGYNGTPRGMMNCNEGGCKNLNMRQFSFWTLNRPRFLKSNVKIICVH
jgi:dCMP deaminase